MVLAALLPFEPREAALALPGMRLTILEGVAAAATAVIAWERRSELASLLRRPPGPLLGLAGFVAANWLSAALAEAPRLPALKFSVRMTACAVFAFLVAVCGQRLQQRALQALAWSSLLVALLAVLEGAGVLAVDPLLDAFRTAPVFVGGTRRASAGSEHPNLAAAFVGSGVLIWSGLAPGAARLIPPVTLLVVGLLLTYSRGGLLATIVGLVVMLGVRGRWGHSTRPPATALVVLLSGSAAFAGLSETFRLRIGDPSPDDWFLARYSPAMAALRLTPGAERPLAVDVENIGRATWRIEDVQLEQRWLDLDTRSLRDGPPTALPHQVGPGQRAAIVVMLHAPQRAGRYRVFFDSRLKRGRWFSEWGVAPGIATVTVTESPEVAEHAGPDAPPTDIPAGYWNPTRAEFMRLALAMWSDRPLVGVGPDNFRRLHARYAGRHLNFRSSAGNAFLEVAATTGLMGLVAFVATLGASIVAGVRGLAARVAEPTWAALLVSLLAAVIVHACVDYSLSATGHYLFFAFVVGGLASPAFSAPAPPGAKKTT